MAEKVKVLIGGREKIIEKKVADLLVKINKAKYAPAVNEYKTRMMVAERPAVVNVQKEDKKEVLKKILDDAGIEYDGRLGEAKLQELVDNLKDE